MRALAAVLICLCPLVASSPASALEYCDKIADAGKRMACLQERISHLEEQMLAMSNQIVDLRNALRLKLDAAGVYKLQHMGQMDCLGVEDKALGLQGCDHPDAWKLLPGSQKPGKESQKPDKDKDKDKDKKKSN